MNFKLLITAVLFTIAIFSDIYADSVRCRNTLVSTGDSIYRVLQRQTAQDTDFSKWCPIEN